MKKNLIKKLILASLIGTFSLIAFKSNTVASNLHQIVDMAENQDGEKKVKRVLTGFVDEHIRRFRVFGDFNEHDKFKIEIMEDSQGNNEKCVTLERTPVGKKTY